MKLSTKGKYGLIAMADLSKYYNPNNYIYIPLNNIALKNNISEAYLKRLIIKLRNAGFVKTQRGVLGGYSLAKSPSNISISDLLEILEGPIDICGCRKQIKKCNIVKNCVSRFIGNEITKKIKEVIDNITLFDLLKKTYAEEDN